MRPDAEPGQGALETAVGGPVERDDEVEQLPGVGAGGEGLHFGGEGGRAGGVRDGEGQLLAGQPVGEGGRRAATCWAADGLGARLAGISMITGGGHGRR